MQKKHFILITYLKEYKCANILLSEASSSSSKLNNRQEGNRGKYHVDEVNIVLLRHEALAEAVLTR
jgi:hypothetical protein